MQKLLATACALIALTGYAVAQSSTTNTPTPTPNTGSSPSNTSPSANQPGSMNPAPQAGAVQRVEGASIIMSYYTANPADTRATKLIGRTVYNLNNENIGEVNDIIIDNGKTIKAIVVGVGGFLGMGERNVAIAPASIVMSELGDGTTRLVVNTNRDDLKKVQAFDLTAVDKAGPNAGGASTGTQTKK